MTCFAKDKVGAEWASCRETCDATTAKGWSCKALGERTKYPAGPLTDGVAFPEPR